MFLFYARGVDNTILSALNKISMEQNKSTTETQQKYSILMNYLIIHPEATLHYHPRNIKLYIETDSAYLVLPEAQSRVAAYLYLGDKYKTLTKKSSLNEEVHVLCRIIPNAVFIASKAETEGIYSGTKEVVPIINAFEEMGYSLYSSSVPITTDSITAHGILN